MVSANVQLGRVSNYEQTVRSHNGRIAVLDTFCTKRTLVFVSPTALRRIYCGIQSTLNNWPFPMPSWNL
jgi:hypothetical protein